MPIIKYNQKLIKKDYSLMNKRLSAKFLKNVRR